MRIWYAYLWVMKERKNLTLKPETIAILSMQGTSLSDAIDQLAKEAQRDPVGPETDEPLFMKWMGKLGDWLTDEDFEEDDRPGYELRKTRLYKQKGRAK